MTSPSAPGPVSGTEPAPGTEPVSGTEPAPGTEPVSGTDAVGSQFPRRYAATQRFTLGAPRSIRVAADDSRVVFARSTSGDDPVNRLWSLDLTTGIETMVADPVALLAGGQVEITDAERARRERAREAGGGIVRWASNANLTTAVYVLGGRVFLTDIAGGTTIELDTADGAYDPRLSPSGSSVAYVAGRELRVSHFAGFAPPGDRLIARSEYPDVTWGLAEFVAAEEMGRSRGFWWGPDDHHLLAARVDNRRVAEWTIAAPVEPWKPARTVRYPAAGETNATVDLVILNIEGARPTHTPISWQGEEFEYLATASWGSRAKPVLTVQTRDQRTTAILEVDPATGETEELYRWTDSTWIELIGGTPTWDGDRLVTVEDRGAARRLVVDGQAITGDDLQVLSIVKMQGGTAVVSATTESSETHVFRINTTTGTAEQLSPEPGVHHVAMGNQVSVMISSTLNQFGSVARVNDGRELKSLAETPDVLPVPQIVRAGPHDIRTAVLLPSNHSPDDGPLPVLLDPYGGPHARRVLRSRNTFLTSQWFADQGFAVIVADGRGTPARGPAFEREVYGDLATKVLEDQVTALHAASGMVDLDLGRVAIRGWSFGGYLAALAVIRRPDVFHAAVAGAPVTDWRLYDTHYTERYMGHPATVPEHYDACDLCAEAAELTRPLQLIHGLADDNVVAAHTLALSRALLAAGRPHQVLPLSGVTHMTPQEEVAENLLRLQLEFLRSSLQLDGPPLEHRPVTRRARPPVEPQLQSVSGGLDESDGLTPIVPFSYDPPIDVPAAAAQPPTPSTAGAEAATDPREAPTIPQRPDRPAGAGTAPRIPSVSPAAPAPAPEIAAAVPTPQDEEVFEGDPAPATATGAPRIPSGKRRPRPNTGSVTRSPASDPKR